MNGHAAEENDQEETEMKSCLRINRLAMSVPQPFRPAAGNTAVKVLAAASRQIGVASGATNLDSQLQLISAFSILGDR